MRFDDRLATLLDQPLRSDSAKAFAWAQLVDYVAQRGAGSDGVARDQLLQRIEALKGAVPAERRASVARAIASSRVHPDAVDLLGNDIAPVAAPLVTIAQMGEANWLRIVPNWPSASRALLRERRDLPQALATMLGNYAAADFALNDQSAGQVAETAAAPTPIQELVDRIEAFQRRRVLTAPVPDSTESVTSATAAGFRFETDRDGRISWIDGASRGAVIGLTISEMASPGSFGVDGHAAGAFRQRATFANARLLLPGAGDVSGHWLISGDPVFRHDDGRFTGYRGVARRPAPHEHLNAAQSPPPGPPLPDDSFRQLAHELRTPINAISGFSEMIEGQMLGPVANHYRDRARAIMIDASRLAEVLEDADAFAKPMDERPRQCDPIAIITQVHAELEPRARQKMLGLHFELARDVAEVGLGPEVMHRLASRLVAAMTLIADEGEEIRVRLARAGDRITLVAAVPNAFAGAERDAFLDPEVAIFGDIAQGGRMEAAFSLHHVENLARSVGARLEFAAGEVRLDMPVASAVDLDAERGKGHL